LKQLKSTISERIFGAVLAAALVTVFSAAPARAQDHPAAQSTPLQAAPVAQNQAAPESQAKKDDAEGENAFRHTAMVQSLSDLFFHDNPNDLDPAKRAIRANHVELTARIFEWINFLIIALCIVIPLVKYLPRVFRKRSQTLKQQLETARQTAADASARLSAVEAQMAHLDEEIAAIRAQVEEDSKQDEARIKASIEEEKARIVAAAEQEIAAVAAHAQRGLRHFAADLAIDQAARQIILTPETDRALIAEFVSETGGNGAASRGKVGGQN
jgi:F-type H+-transporting ATPase subunit b